ncbi:MAG: 50S ribosomal protein L23 [Candidatus Aenigmarchaeota archaeon]|nr:50S ribosomal protein L23 [Candidatus Aenigmarchaeota archaeon]
MAETKKDTTVKEKETKKKEVPKEERKTKKKDKKVLLDALKILEYPHLTEKSINNIEMNNKLVFVVKRNAKKDDIKTAVEKAFDVKVKKVNVMTTTKGNKKAIVSLLPEFSAVDVATKLGMM